MKTHPTPRRRGPFPTVAQHRGGHGADRPDTAETPVTAAAPAPIPGSDGPQPDLADPDRSRRAPAPGRHSGGAANSPLEEGSRHHTLSADRGRPTRLLHPPGPARAWWELLVVVAGGGAGAGLGYRVGRSRLGRTPREREGCAT
ncbi:MAG: hypothetical protein QOE59_2399 [Actinomycetota bacterium]|nr:hypothetical protein [Actinomycetota bacterium]